MDEDHRNISNPDFEADDNCIPPDSPPRGLPRGGGKNEVRRPKTKTKQQQQPGCKKAATRKLRFMEPTDSSALKTTSRRSKTAEANHTARLAIRREPSRHKMMEEAPPAHRLFEPTANSSRRVKEKVVKHAAAKRRVGTTRRKTLGGTRQQQQRWSAGTVLDNPPQQLRAQSDLSPHRSSNDITSPWDVRSPSYQVTSRVFRSESAGGMNTDSSDGCTWKPVTRWRV